ncbi:hypothetical protein ERJ75_001707000 [Trypanosoma vivax]|nr:hypothetical protein ERJ75_001707000 [Trypanosoma vivax]
MDSVALLAEEMKRMREKIKAAEAQETVRVAAQELALVLTINDTKHSVLCKIRAHLSTLKIGIGEVRVRVRVRVGVGVVSGKASRMAEVRIEVGDIHLRIKH